MITKKRKMEYKIYLLIFRDMMGHARSHQIL